jgi:hypothetical protein
MIMRRRRQASIFRSIEFAVENTTFAEVQKLSGAVAIQAIELDAWPTEMPELSDPLQ